MATTRTRPVHGHGPGASQPPRGGSNGRGGGGNGSGGRRRPSPRKKRNPILTAIGWIFRIAVTVIVCAVVGLLIGFYIAMKNLPSSVSQIENYKPFGRTTILSSDGTVLAALFQQNRQNVTIDKIPLNLQHATVAIEDSRFYTDKYGIDIRGIGRAIFHDVHGNDITAQGGSTITQQLVRNLGIDGVGREKSITRKIKEAMLAIEISRNYSKQQILEMYLNDVYYGSGAYGVQAAAQVYFGKTVDHLDLAQCALLAGLPQRPSGPHGLSPYINKDAAKTRRDTVLARMQELGYISPDQYQQAVNEPIILAFPHPPTAGSKTYHAAYFVDYIVKQLTARYGSDFIYRGGIKVTTTLNWEMQQAAEKAVTDGLARIAYTGATDAALVSIEPQTGYIKAMVGGADYSKNQYNIVIGRRQPGSSFKPIIYTAALDSGLITENTRILDEPVSFPSGHGGQWTPHNDDDRYRGWVTAKTAVALSINTCAVRLLHKVGVDTAIRYARMMGVHAPLAPYLPLALGASAVSPLEMADVYATIENKGQRPITTGIMQITDDSGQILEDNVPKLETTSISASACTQMTDMLRAVINEGTGYIAFADGQLSGVCGKTGTTQNHQDVWFDGFTKDLVTVVWAGHPSVDPKTHRNIYGIPMSHEAFGGTVSAPIWKQFMITAVAVEEREQAKAAKLAKPKPIIIAPSSANSDSGDNSNSDNTDPDTDTNVYPGSDSTNDGTDNSATDDNSQGVVQGDTGPNTTTVWVDNATGQPVPAGSPNAHQETFAKGYAPPVPSAAPNNDTTSPDNGDDSNSTPDNSNQDQNSAPATTAAVPAAPKMVTVTVCAESGLLATKWCPETVDESFVAGSQPKRYCNIHKPPPGER